MDVALTCKSAGGDTLSENGGEDTRSEKMTGCSVGSLYATPLDHRLCVPFRPWEADPLLCPKCANTMRIVALIDDRDVIEKILRHLGLWQQGVRVMPSRAPPANETVIELWPDNPFPDYDTDPVMAWASA